MVTGAAKVSFDWEVVPLGAVATFRKGAFLAKSDLMESGGYPCVHYGELFTKYGAVIEDVASRTKSRLPVKGQKGDVLMPTSDVTPRGLAKASALNVGDVGLGGDILVIHPDPKRIDGRFLAFLIRQSEQKVLALVKGSTVYHLYASDMRHLEVALPPLEEQRAIAQALEDADRLIESLEKLIAKKRDIKQATMQQLLTGRTRLPGFAGEWLTSTIGDMARVVGGGTPSTKVPSFWGGQIPWFTPAEIPESGAGVVWSSARRITPAGLASCAATVLPVGSVLVTSRASIGNCAIAGTAVATNQGFTSLVPNDQRSTRFLYYWVQQNRPKLVSRAAGSTFLEISRSKVADIELEAPEPEEQEAIGTALADMDREIEILEERLAKTRDIKVGMMQQLLTGRTRLVIVSEGAA